VHIVTLFISLLVGIGIILYALKKLSYPQQNALGFSLALVAALAVILKLVWKIIVGEFDYILDLPIHMCHFSALAVPFMMARRNRKLFSFLYFWIIVGTLNALLTPDVEENFPHIWYFQYWIEHSTLVIVILYAVFIYGMRPTWKDFWIALLATNIFLVVSLIVNFSIGSNYFYTRAKPEIASLLDIFGPWPWYLIQGQLMLLAFFLIAIAPFLRNQKV
jgi:hypothetical integral membrane protein (TIGR02206 family)